MHHGHTRGKQKTQSIKKDVDFKKSGGKFAKVGEEMKKASEIGGNVLKQ